MIATIPFLKKIFCCTALAFCLTPLAAAQSKYNFDFGGGPGWPVGPTSRFVTPSYNFVAGAGLNLRAHVKFVGEFMFHGIPPEQSLIQAAGVPGGKGRLYSGTGNIMIGTGNSKTGAYLIGGGGFYRRTMLATQTVFKQGSFCAPIWEWWNVQCINGVFPSTETIASYTSNAFGVNAGGGFTYALGQTRANLYVEVRYHCAFTSRINTQVLPVTIGVRF